MLSERNPRIGAYSQLVEAGRDLHELHALIAPRPFLVSGGSEDPPERWKALNHAIAVNALLGARTASAWQTVARTDPRGSKRADRALLRALPPPAMSRTTPVRCRNRITPPGDTW